MMFNVSRHICRLLFVCDYCILDVGFCSIIICWLIVSWMNVYYALIAQWLFYFFYLRGFFCILVFFWWIYVFVVFAILRFGFRFLCLLMLSSCVCLCFPCFPHLLKTVSLGFCWINVFHVFPHLNPEGFFLMCLFR